MNHYIQIALILWTLLFAALMFYTCIAHASDKKPSPALIAGTLSFLSLFTALLAVGQYIH